MADIVVTWPKSRHFASYMVELERAKSRGLIIHYRVRHLPDPQPERCYMVHDGAVRGWLLVTGQGAQPGGRVLDPITGGFWRAGNYITRDPEWHSVKPCEMQGFRGWRWFDRSLAPDR